jgi:hypothetical protein
LRLRARVHWAAKPVGQTNFGTTELSPPRRSAQVMLPRDQNARDET